MPAFYFVRPGLRFALNLEWQKIRRHRLSPATPRRMAFLQSAAVETAY
jgi:hypothetical protein